MDTAGSPFGGPTPDSGSPFGSPSPGGGSTGDIGGPPVAEDTSKAVKASPAWLVAAAAALAASAVLIIPFSAVTSLVGYLLAGVLTAVLVSVYRSSDQRARRDSYYVGGRFLGMSGDLATKLMLFACWVLAMPHVWVLATTAGRF